METGTTSSTTAAAAVAGLASDYTWSMILVTMACAVMVVVSAMNGVRRFSFALTYTNLWYIFGKRGRLRLRVHSFTSTNGSSCFVTTSGEFCAELVKEEEELEKQLDLGYDHQPNDIKGPGAARAGCIVGTEMVITYNDRTSVFTAGSLARFPPPQRKSYREALCTPLSARSNQESLTRTAHAVRAAGELPEWQLGAFRSGNGSDGQFCTDSSLVPDWALDLMEPLQIARCQISPFSLVERSVRSSPREIAHSWDLVLKLRLAGAQEGRRPVSIRRKEIVYPSAVVPGATHTATLSNNVVKLWDNSARLSVASLPLSSSNNFVSSFDVNWEKDTVAFGSSTGEVSLWDLERAKCVTSFRGHEGSISSIHFNAADRVEQDGWVLTAGRSAAESGSCLSLWDSRALNAAGLRSEAGRFPSIDDLKCRNYEAVARDENSRISVYDIRMLNSSPVFSVSADEVRSFGCKGGAQVGPFGPEEEKWWDACAIDESFGEDADWEDDWGTVDFQETVKSPSVLSRCFNALSSAISR